MFTLCYKGWFIHGYCDKDECNIESANCQQIYPVKNMRAAKLQITAHIKKQQDQ